MGITKRMDITESERDLVDRPAARGLGGVTEAGTIEPGVGDEPRPAAPEIPPAPADPTDEPAARGRLIQPDVHPAAPRLRSPRLAGRCRVRRFRTLAAPLGDSAPCAGCGVLSDIGIGSNPTDLSYAAVLLSGWRKSGASSSPSCVVASSPMGSL